MCFFSCAEWVVQVLYSHLLESDSDQEEPPDVEEPVHKLKEAIGKAMPEQIARFHESCQVYEHVKTLK